MLDLNYQYVKWLDNELANYFQKAGFVIKSCFLYTKLDGRND